MKSTMWFTRTAAAAMLVVMSGLPALAQPIEIATLGRAPLMSTQLADRAVPTADQSRQIRQAAQVVHANDAMLHRAATALGVTDPQYVTFKDRLDKGQAHWDRLPRHLEAMSYGVAGTPRVLRDVNIPTHEYGAWVEGIPTDVPGKTLTMYLPAKCGNLSLNTSYIPPPPPLAVRPQPHPLVASTQEFPVSQPPPVEPPPLVAAVSPIPVGGGCTGFFKCTPIWPVVLLPLLIHHCSGGDCVTPPPNVGTVVGPPPCP